MTAAEKLEMDRLREERDRYKEALEKIFGESGAHTNHDPEKGDLCPGCEARQALEEA